MEKLARMMYAGKTTSLMGVTQREIHGYIDYNLATGEIFKGVASDSMLHSNNIQRPGSFTTDGLKFTATGDHNSNFTIEFDLRPTKEPGVYEGEFTTERYRGLAKIMVGLVTEDIREF